MNYWRILISIVMSLVAGETLILNPVSAAMVRQSCLASFYGTEACKYNKTDNCLMANGETIYGQEDYAAMWKVKFGTVVTVCNRANGKCTKTVVKDRGPSRRLSGRCIDLSPKGFGQIGNVRKGLIPVEVSYEV